MTQLHAQEPRRVYRGTWEEILARSNEIAGSSEVEVKVFGTEPITDDDPTIALLESWLAQAPSDPEAIREAEEDLREFKQNMNLPRKQTGARLHYPEAECA